MIGFRTLVTLLVILVIALLFGGVLAVDVTLAQEDTEATEDDSNDEQSAPEHQTTFEFSSDLRLVGWAWNDGVWVAEFAADERTTITVYEIPNVNNFEGGEPYSEDFTIRSDGTTTVEFEPPMGVGVQMVESGSIYMEPNPDRQDVQVQTNEDRTLEAIFVSGVVILALIICSAGAYYKIQQRRSKRVM